MRRALSIMVIALAACAAAWAGSSRAMDPRPVAPGVYAVIGDLGPQTRANGGLNANLGFVVGANEVLVINSGPSNQAANGLRDAIRTVSDKPIRWVVNLNSQSHYWWGNRLFEEAGATVIAHPNATRLMHEQAGMQRETLEALLGHGFSGTLAAFPSDHVDSQRRIDLGGTQVQLLHLGPAHTPGDLVVWLPKERILFSGDLVYVERLPAVLPFSSTKDWLSAFAKMESLDPLKVVPGHGVVTTLPRARSDTRDYLLHLRKEAGVAMKAGLSPSEAATRIDQARWKDLVNFEALAKRNASQVFIEIEKEEF